MRNLRLTLGVLALVASTTLNACPPGMSANRNMQSGNSMMSGSGMGNQRGGCTGKMSMLRHRYVEQNGIPAAYGASINPLRNSVKIINAGKQKYQQNCASCHGESGRGDGVVSKSLNPLPTNIARFSKMPMATDGYLMWTISEGGIPLNTAMPAFKSLLNEADIWEIVTYLRQL